MGIRNSYGNYNSQTKEACAKYQTYQSELEATGISANCEARENDDGQHRDCLRKFNDTLGKANRYAHKYTTNVIGNVTLSQFTSMFAKFQYLTKTLACHNYVFTDSKVYRWNSTNFQLNFKVSKSNGMTCQRCLEENVALCMRRLYTPMAACAESMTALERISFQLKARPNVTIKS